MHSAHSTPWFPMHRKVGRFNKGRGGYEIKFGNFKDSNGTAALKSKFFLMYPLKDTENNSDVFGLLRETREMRQGDQEDAKL